MEEIHCFDMIFEWMCGIKGSIQ